LHNNSNMETRFIINGFNKLSIDEQNQIMDFVSGITPIWKIEEIENERE